MLRKIMKLIESKTISLFILVKLQDIFEIEKKKWNKMIFNYLFCSSNLEI
jgi:hypothetical protein